MRVYGTWSETNGAKMSKFLHDLSSFLPHVAFPVDRFECNAVVFDMTPRLVFPLSDTRYCLRCCAVKRMIKCCLFERNTFSTGIMLFKTE